MADLTGAGPNMPPMRASDADRHATVLLLQDAMARGLLTPDEGSERMAAAFAAVHRRDLGPLTADLPPAPPNIGSAPGWRTLLLMFFEQLRSFFQNPDNGKLNRSRVVIAFLVAAAVVLAFGLMSSDLFGAGTRRPAGIGHH